MGYTFSSDHLNSSIDEHICKNSMSILVSSMIVLTFFSCDYFVWVERRRPNNWNPPYARRNGSIYRVDGVDGKSCESLAWCVKSCESCDNSCVCGCGSGGDAGDVGCGKNSALKLRIVPSTENTKFDKIVARILLEIFAWFCLIVSRKYRWQSKWRFLSIATEQNFCMPILKLIRVRCRVTKNAFKK